MSENKTIIFSDLGFPIIYVDCPHDVVDGLSYPSINYEEVEERIFESLPCKPTNLSGSEIKFIRHHLKMTQEAFANWLDDINDKSTVCQWEKKDLEPTTMDAAMERSVRLQLIQYIIKRKRKLTIKLGEVNQGLTNAIKSHRSDPIEYTNDINWGKHYPTWSPV